MSYLIILLCSYLLGSINPAYFIGRWKGTDLKENGSGNLGASNATSILGWKIGILVAVHDVLKGAVAVWLAMLLFPHTAHAGEIAGLSAVLGHIFPFYLSFRGGKGFASYVGMTIALDWKLAIAVIVLAFVITVVTDYIALGTIATSLVVPVWRLYTQPSRILMVFFAVSSCVIIYKHKDNISRMLRRQEIGLRSTIRGEHRVK